MIRTPTCPICEKALAPKSAADSPLFPFCSVRCKQIDLYRWTQGKYAIAESLTPERLIDELSSHPDDLDNLVR